MAVFALQFVALLFWSWHLWTRFDLTNDMATFGQAFSQIGTGHLNPYETTFPHDYPHWGYPFYQSHFELLMWPLASLYTVTRSLFVLLVVQDLALAVAGLAALRWGLDVLWRGWPDGRRGASLVAAGLIIVLVVNPWTIWTVSFDFHFQTIATCFAVLAARDAWNGRQRAWLWVALVLACGDVAATYVIAVGLIAILTNRKMRWTGVGFIGTALVWLMLIGVLHAAKGSSLSAGYGYLAGHNVKDGLPGMAAILAGLGTHPHRAFLVVDGRWHQMYQYLAGSGLIGIASFIGLVPVLSVLVVNGLNSNSIYVSHIAAFQNVFIVFFMGVGAVSVLTWLARRRRRGALALTVVVGLAALVQACVVSSLVAPQARTTFAAVSAPTAAAVASVRGQIPPTAEGVVSIGVIGRFAERPYLYPYGYTFPGGQSVPIHTRTVYFVFTRVTGVQSASVEVTDRAVQQLVQLGARIIVDSNELVALVWNPPSQVKELQLADT
jgi:hypothetical protein